MTDLDVAVREMLRERAQDITTLPADFAHLSSLDVLDHDPIFDLRRRRRSGWLLAAVVAAVLTVAGVTVGITRGTPDRRTPVQNHSHVTGAPTPTPAPTLPPSPHAAREVKLAWFGLRTPPGYSQTLLISQPGYRMIELLRAHETGAAPCNGCGAKSAQVFVFDKGRFDPAKHGILGPKSVSIQQHHGYFGPAYWYGGPRTEVATLAWQYGPDAWAMVQGLTPDASSRTALTRIADATEPTVDVPIGLPFTLAYVPDLPITEIYDNRPAGYTESIQFGPANGKGSFQITLWNGPVDAYANVAGIPRRTVGGLRGYYSPEQGATVAYHGGVVNLGFDETGRSNSASAKAAEASDRATMELVLAGLHWTNGDGRPPLVPAARAIP